MKSAKYPYARPYVRDSDIKAVSKVLKNQYLTEGSEILNFESNISSKTGAKYSIACNSGTAALHLLYKSIGLKKNDTILTSPITFIATANAAKMCGANVIFADVDPVTGLLTSETIEKKIIEHKKKIKAVVVVHLGGRVCDMLAISKIAKKYSCILLEDACHAIGAIYKTSKVKKYVGSCKYSLASTFSFHAIKNITTAEGGCITTNNYEIYKKIKLLRSHHLERNIKKISKLPERNAKWYYEAKEVGWNYRLNELSCALGNSQINYLESNIKKRNQLAKFYNRFLKDNEYIVRPQLEHNSLFHAWHLYSVLIDFKRLNKTKSYLMKELLDLGIGSQVHYIPLIMQPIYKNMNSGKFTNTFYYYHRTLSLPIYIGLNKADIEYISKSLIKLIMKK